MSEIADDGILSISDAAEIEQDAHIRTWREDRFIVEMRNVVSSTSRAAAEKPAGRAVHASGRRIAARQVDNPMLTDGLAYSEQRNTHLKVTVEENTMTRIGALAFIRRREGYHERAAEEFKSLYEARYGGQGGAMDPGRVQVDTSPVAHDSGMAAKIDRTVKLEMALKSLDKAALNRLVACVILGVSCEDQSDTLPSGRANQRQSGRCVDETLAALDHLATIWGYKTRAA